MSFLNCPVCENLFPGAKPCEICGFDAGRLNESALALPPGTLLHNGAYGTGNVLGRGGFGITYLGWDKCLRRNVAIKEFFPQGCIRRGNRVLPGGDFPREEYERSLRKFLEEAQILARFQNPGIVSIFTVFEENDSAYIVMELIKGKTLKDMMSGAAPLPPGEAVGYVRKAGEALETVHQGGILHRDLKPENIIVTPDGRVVLVDFGIARKFVRDKATPMTAMVTEGYAPIEQYSHTISLGPYSDVYALSATLYYLLTGGAPVVATDRAAGVALPAVIELNPKVSRELSDAISEGLSFDPSKRPQSVRDFLKLMGESPGSGGRSPEPHLFREPQPPASPIPQPSTPLASGVPLRPRGAEMLRLEGHNGWVRAIAFSPGGDILASGSEDRTVRLWKLSEGTEIRRFKEHDAWIFALAFSPSGEYLAAAGHDKRIFIWDVRSGVELQRLRGDDGALCVTFSPDGRTLAAGFRDRSVIFWELPSGREKNRIISPGESVLDLSYSPDGALLATGHSVDPEIVLWHIPSMKEAMRIKGHTDSVRTLSFSRNGTYLASGSTDRTVRLFESSSGRELGCFKGHRGPVHSVAFSPDGSELASCSSDQSIRLWEVPSGKLTLTIEGHRGEVHSLAWSPQGGLIASGSQDQTVRLWHVGR